jgi:hypothetical protein
VSSTENNRVISSSWGIESSSPHVFRISIQKVQSRYQCVQYVSLWKTWHALPSPRVGLFPPYHQTDPAYCFRSERDHGCHGANMQHVRPYLLQCYSLVCYNPVQATNWLTFLNVDWLPVFIPLMPLLNYMSYVTKGGGIFLNDVLWRTRDEAEHA